MTRKLFGIDVTVDTTIGEVQDVLPIATRASVKRLFREATNEKFVPSEGIINRCCDVYNILTSEIMELDMDMTIGQVVPYLLDMLIEDHDFARKELDDIKCIANLLIDIFNDSPLPGNWKRVIYKYITSVSELIQQIICTIVNNGCSDLEQIGGWIEECGERFDKLNSNLQEFIAAHESELQYIA